jgi:hypothetical protein
MQIENVLYAISQLIHNFGAVAVTALPLIALRFALIGPQLRMTYKLIGLAWVVQSASGAGFGAISYYIVGSLPELHHIAISALLLKITCALSSIALIIAKLMGHQNGVSDRLMLSILSVLGMIALSSAAILRWFS